MDFFWKIQHWWLHNNLQIFFLIEPKEKKTPKNPIFSETLFIL